MAKKKTVPKPAQIHLRPSDELDAALWAEVEAKNKGGGPKWTMNAYVLWLIATHPDRAKKGK